MGNPRTETVHAQWPISVTFTHRYTSSKVHVFTDHISAVCQITFSSLCFYSTESGDIQGVGVVQRLPCLPLSQVYWPHFMSPAMVSANGKWKEMWNGVKHKMKLNVKWSIKWNNPLREKILGYWGVGHMFSLLTQGQQTLYDSCALHAHQNIPQQWNIVMSRSVRLLPRQTWN